MPDLPRSHLAGYVVVALAVLVLGVRQVSRSRADDRARAVQSAPIAVDRGRERGGRVVVHVAGAVRRPGVYRVRSGMRVDDAVRRAGGATARADLTQVNLAAEVEDGRQIVVPARVRAAAPAPGGGAAGAPAGPLNLNTATLEQLDELEGIGPVTAQSILDYRAEHSGFGSVEELDQVSGIGEATMAALREKVTA